MEKQKADYKQFGFWMVKDLSAEKQEEIGDSLDADQIYVDEYPDEEKVFLCPHCGGYIIHQFHWNSEYSPCEHFLFSFGTSNNEFNFVSDSFTPYLKGKYLTHEDFEGEEPESDDENDMLEFFNNQCPDGQLFFLDDKEPGLETIDDIGSSGCGGLAGLIYGIGNETFIKKLESRE